MWSPYKGVRKCQKGGSVVGAQHERIIVIEFILLLPLEMC